MTAALTEQRVPDTAEIGFPALRTDWERETRQVPAIHLAAESARLMRLAIEPVRLTERAFRHSPNDEP